MVLLLVGCGPGRPEPTDPSNSDFVGDGARIASVDRLRIEVQENIAHCMAGLGFEYVPIATSQIYRQDRDRGVLDDRAWTERYGYGIVSSALEFARPRADPNVELVAALSPAERDRYLVSLDGEGESPGCRAIGLERAAEAAALVSELDAIVAERSAALAELMASPELVAPLASWSRCMAEHGFEARDPDALRAWVQGEAQRVTVPVQAWLAALDPSARAAAIRDGLQSAPHFPVEALTALQAVEIEIARTDLDCYESHVRDAVELHI